MKNEKENIDIVEIINNYRKFKKFIKDILINLNLERKKYGNNCKEIWYLINNSLNKKINYKMFKKIENNIKKKWVYYIKENKNKNNKCVLIEEIE